MRAFTMVELLVVIFIVLILLSIFVPYGLHLREMSRRTDCAENLRQIFGALQTYAHDNSSMFPRTKCDSASAWAGYQAFTGSESPDPFAADSTVKANDVTASYWLLYRIGYLTKSSYFVCNGDDASPDRYANEKARSNFASANNLSYSFATPFSSNSDYKLTSDLPSAFVLAADINPEGEDAARLQKSEMNSNSHRGAGQNVLYAYGAVEFKSSPKVALAGDNIYTLRPRSTTAPTTIPSSQPAVDLAPWDTTDSYLVPKLSDRK